MIFILMNLCIAFVIWDLTFLSDIGEWRIVDRILYLFWAVLSLFGDIALYKYAKGYFK